MRLLVVDDETEVAELLADILRGEGHEVDICHDGKEALVRMESAAYELVLSDLRMPRLDGPGLHAEVARRWPGRERRLVFVTGDGFSAECQEFLERSGARHLAKPFSVGELRRLLLELSGASGAAGTSAPPRAGSDPPERDG